MATLLGSAFVRIDADTSPALRAIQGMGALGATALNTAVSPVIAAVGAGAGAVASSLAVAGAAAGGFAAAVIPQFNKITEAGEKLEASEAAQEKATLAKRQAQELARDAGVKYGDQIEITAGMSDEARARAEEYNKALQASKTATEAARKSQAIYDEKMAAMAPATRDTAKAFEGLKDDLDAWSDSLSGSTMPVFTRGIEFLRDLLPKLTPTVRAVAAEISDFSTTLGEGTAGRTFREFGKNVQANGAGALRSFLDTARNLAVGFTGVLNAFMPMSAGLTGGLTDLTARFAEWGASLGSSDGFTRFVTIAQEAAPRIGELLRALGGAFLDVASAAGPLAGIGLEVITILARLVEAVPTPVLELLVPAILAVNAALKLYAVYQTAATAYTWAFTTSVTASNGAIATSRAALLWFKVQQAAYAVASGVSTAATWAFTTATRAGTLAMRLFSGVLRVARAAVLLTAGAFRALAVAMLTNPIGLVITALVALGAGLYVAWQKSETFRTIVRAAWQGVKDIAQSVLVWFTGSVLPFFTQTIPGAFRTVLDWVRTNWPWLLGALTGPIGLAVVWIVKNWDGIRSGLLAVWQAVVRNVVDPLRLLFTVVLPTAAGIVRDKVAEAWGALRDRVAGAYRSIRDKVLTPVRTFFTERIPGWARTVRDRVALAWTILRDRLAGAYRSIRDKVLTPVREFFTERMPGWARTVRDRVSGAWTALRDRIAGAYRSIRDKVLTPVREFFTDRVPGWGRTLRDRVSGAWTTLRDRLVGVYRGLRDRVFNPIREFFTERIPGWARTLRDRVKDFFRGMRDGVGQLWNGIKNKTKAPVNWVLKNVWNNGIVKVWGKIAGWVGLGNALKTVKMLAAGGTVGKAVPGVFSKPTAIVGEGNPRYPEFVIPTDPKYATRARGLWEAAGAHFYESGGILGTIKDKIGSVVGKGVDIGKGAVDFLTNPVEKTKDLLLEPLKRIASSIGSHPWAKLAAKLPRMAVDGLVRAVKSVGSDLLGFGGDGGGGSAGSVDIGGSGVQRWRGVVRQALGLVGQPRSYDNITLRRMNQESGGNPTVVNKWDSNWLAGYPSVGLMQVIRPTYQANAGRFRNTGPFLYGVSVNPLANIFASMQYALRAYGSLPRAYNRAGGYALGTAGSSAGWHWVGEHGPELMKLPAGAQVRSHRQSVRQTPASAAVVHLTVENHGVIGSRLETENWLVSSLDQLRKQNRLPKVLGGGR